MEENNTIDRESFQKKYPGLSLSFQSASQSIPRNLPSFTNVSKLKKKVPESQ